MEYVSAQRLSQIAARNGVRKLVGEESPLASEGFGPHFFVNGHF
jgi:hypothetical protein